MPLNKSEVKYIEDSLDLVTYMDVLKILKYSPKISGYEDLKF